MTNVSIIRYAIRSDGKRHGNLKNRIRDLTMKQKVLSPLERAQACAFLCALHAGSVGYEDGLTSHDLAHFLGVTPATIRNNLNRHGRRINIQKNVVSHRPTSNKALYTFSRHRDNEVIYAAGRAAYYKYAVAASERSMKRMTNRVTFTSAPLYIEGGNDGD